MCGIACVFDGNLAEEPRREVALSMARRLLHRGPDWSGCFSDDFAALAHQRLAIVDIEGGEQPLRDARTGVTLAVNGEIYNHRELRESLREEHEFSTNSDCEVLLYLYLERGPDFFDDVDGSFAFVLYDPRDREVFIARDHIGIVPLYWARTGDGRLLVASEMKALIDHADNFEEFPPGHRYLRSADRLTRYYDPEWAEPDFDAFVPWNAEELRSALDQSVTRRLMSDVPYGLLISGGVDSSIVAALALRHAGKRVESGEKEPAWWPQLHSFCIGLENAPDFQHAVAVAEHIGAVHHQYEYTVQDGFDCLRDVIHHLETFDITTIRAGTPMFLLARRIRSMGMKMVLSGEGADEIFAGYLYFHKAPNPAELREETIRKLFGLHKYDCLRANKATSAWSVEARVPFLAKNVLDLVMRIDPTEKMTSKDRLEKFILRRSFDGYIPNSVLYRQKEQFSDGVGYSWIDMLRANAEKLVSDDDMRGAAERFPVKTPLTKEGYWYRTLFEELFPGDHAAACVKAEPSIACSTETALRWDAEFQGRADPSGRAVARVHEDSYE